MRAAIGPIVVSIFLFGLLQAAFAGNGVERGTISFGNTAIPAILQNKLEHAIFGSCDLRGATEITPTFVAFADSAAFQTGYFLDFAVKLDNNERTVFITVEAVVHKGAEPKAEVVHLSSSICRSF